MPRESSFASISARSCPRSRWTSLSSGKRCLNLLRNAREAMPDGGVAKLEASRYDDGIRIQVHDEGAGISEEEREHVFDLFYTTKERGTGLGLPLTQQIVVAHGGRIACRPRHPQGTTFEIWLPTVPPRRLVVRPCGESDDPRTDGRSYDALRPVTIETRVQRNPEGSVLYRCGGTTVLIAASVSEGVPDWMRDTGRGWLTAEYAMHPTGEPRAQSGAIATKGRIDGRSSEIQRLIGRALRAAIDFEKLGERMITVDCDVLDADGGTRTASITGGMVALAIALDRLRADGAGAERAFFASRWLRSAWVCSTTGPCSTFATPKIATPRWTSTWWARAAGAWSRCKARRRVRRSVGKSWIRCSISHLERCPSSPHTRRTP